MRILQYIPSISEASGGVGAYMQLIARDLGKLCELHVVTHKSEEERVLDNCTVHYMPYKWKPWNNCKKEFLSLLDGLKPDVFHTNCCWMPVSALTAMWAKEAGYKVVYTPHGMLEPYAIKRNYWTKKLPAILLFQKKGLRMADLIHATAETERDNLLRLGWNNNVRVIANCVQIDGIKVKESWKKKNRILFLSRIHPKKGLDFLIDAVAMLKSRMKGFKITIAGNGSLDYIKILKHKIEKNGLSDIFEFIGPVYGNDKWALYKNADLFVLPTFSENFGIVIAESLASGTPVITTDGTPWRELNELKCGWCTEIGTLPTVNALKEFLLCSEKELEKMGKNGRKLVEEKYSSTYIAQQFIDMYRDLLK